VRRSVSTLADRDRGAKRSEVLPRLRVSDQLRVAERAGGVELRPLGRRGRAQVRSECGGIIPGKRRGSERR
jgi:hypothetical protein